MDVPSDSQGVFFFRDVEMLKAAGFASCDYVAADSNAAKPGVSDPGPRR